MARECLFCGEPANSKEHAFPRWLSEVIGGEGDLTHAWENRGGSWTTSGFDLQVRQVCATCNNTWMSELEDSSRDLLVPLVRGERTWPLAAQEQVRLSAWGYKTGTMLALALPQDERWVPPEHYRRFGDTGKPPDGTTIWIAGLVPTLAGGTDFKAGWSKPERLDFRKRDGTLDRHGYRLSFSIAHLVFQVVFEPYGNKLDRPRATRDIWTRIRPISKGEWPPGRWLNLDELERLAEGRFIDPR